MIAEGRCVVGVDDVSGVELPQADPAVDRRCDRGIAELDLGTVDRGLIGSHRGAELVRLGLLLVQLLLRNGLASCQHCGAVEVLLGCGQLRVVFALFCDRLIQRRLQGVRIDLSKGVAGSNVLALHEIDRRQLAVNLTAHRDRMPGLYGARSGQIDRHILCSDLRHANRDYGRRTAGGTRVRGRSMPYPGCGCGGENQNAGEPGPMPA